MRRRVAGRSSAIVATVIVVAVMAFAASASASQRDMKDSEAHSSDPTTFVLEPTWLPPGFSASGGGWVEPVGGLIVGNTGGETTEILGPGGADTNTRLNPIFFTLSYYGYHNPESKNIRLTATRYGYPPRGNLEALGGRHVEVSSNFVPGYFGGNTDSSASWVEHGTYVTVMAQGITKAQLARFVAGLKEHPPPRSS